MKLDALCNFPRQNEEILVLSEEKFDKETLKQSKDNVKFDVGERTLNSSQTEAEDHDGFWQVSVFDSSDSLCSNAAESITMEIQDFEALNCLAHEELRINRGRMDRISDKHSNELEVPELVICYKENSYFDIKDICIDKSMPSCERILFKNDVEREDIHTLLLLERDRTSSLMTGTSEGGHLLPEYPLDSEGKHHESPVNQPSSEDIMRTTVNMYKLAEDVPTSQTLSGATIMLPQQGQSSEDSPADTEMPLKEPSPKSILSMPGVASAEEERASITNEEESNSRSLPNRKETISGNASDESINSCGEKGISDNGNQDNQVASCIPKVTNSQASSFRDHYSHGEASFSMGSAGLVSGHIMYSGPISYSGSLSLRSDSSTTSNRSFAFPILQSEWHSSPVRMAKANRRYLRKRKGWMQELFCCRF